MFCQNCPVRGSRLWGVPRRRVNRCHRARRCQATPLTLEHPLSDRAELVACEHVLNQRGENRLVQRRELHQTRVQTLQPCLRHGIEIHTRWVVLARPLQPTQQNLGGTRIGDHALAHTTLDLGVGTGSRTAGCAVARFTGWNRDGS
jgi:hypothetical protein